MKKLKSYYMHLRHQQQKMELKWIFPLAIGSIVSLFLFLTSLSLTNSVCNACFQFDGYIDRSCLCDSWVFCWNREACGSKSGEVKILLKMLVQKYGFDAVMVFMPQELKNHLVEINEMASKSVEVISHVSGATAVRYMDNKLQIICSYYEARTGHYLQIRCLGMKDSLRPLKALVVASVVNGLVHVVICN